jgi:hypothetical protein
MILKRLEDGRLYEGPAEKLGGDTDTAAQARDLSKMVRAIRDSAEASDAERFMADAILFLLAPQVPAKG